MASLTLAAHHVTVAGKEVVGAPIDSEVQRWTYPSIGSNRCQPVDSVVLPTMLSDDLAPRDPP